MENAQLTTEELLQKINGNPQWEHAYLRLSQEWQNKFLNFCAGTSMLPLTYDPFFKKIFDPEAHPERLSRLLSLILGKELTVRQVLPNESTRIIEEGSLLIMDIVAEMEDGSIADIEIQKIPYQFPGERAACYSSDLLMRQYIRVKHNKGKVFSYHDIKKVYTVIILEKSTKIFNAFPSTYIHRSRQRFDSGLSMELLQEYTFIALDRFQQIKQNKVEGELDAWMHLLSSNNREVQLQIAGQYPHIKDIYEEVTEFRQDIGGVLFMFSDALRILDRNTVQLMIDEMTDELNDLRDEANEWISKNNQLANENNKLENKNSILENENSILENENSILENENSILENENSILENENSILENENSILENENSILETKNNELRNELEKRENRIHELERLLGIS